MLELNGVEATRQIKKLGPDIEVLLLTGQETEELVQQSMEVGLRLYPQESWTRELEAALRAVAEHRTCLASESGEVLFAKIPAADTR